MTERSTVLVVDDELLNRRLLQAVLAPEGHTIIQAKSGDEALSRVFAGGIDLVLLDVMMPGIDGVEVCRRIREELGERTLPVILITALGDPRSRTRGKLAGADDFLTKPVHEDELLARVRNLLAVRRYNTLCERQRRDAEAAARRWKLFSEIAVAGAAARDHAAFVAAAAAPLREALGIDAVAYLELRDEQLEPVAATGALPVALDPVADVAIVSAWPDRVAVAVPIGTEGSFHGALAIARTEPFAPGELALCRALMPHATNAIANVRAALHAKHLDEARRRLSHLLVHDLKSPLSVVSCNLEVLEATDLSDFERHDAIADARTALKRLLGMIVDLLDIAQAEEGRLPFKPELVNLATLLDESVAGFASGIKQSNVTLRRELDAALHATIDPLLIRRVIENLVNNGLRYVGRGGTIEVAARAEDASAVIEVGNNGPAIPPAVRERLFEKYGTAAATQALPNRGLGLYFCRLVAERHGGTIELLDRPGGGVRFVIRIPGAVRSAIAETA